MFHLAAYTTAFAGAATLQDMTAAVDGAFTQRNGHLTFTSPMKLLAAHYTGALVTAAQLSVPSINAIAPHNIYPPNLAVTELTNPNVQDLRDWPLQLPLEEEIAVQATASGAEQENAFLWFGTPMWTADISPARVQSGGDANLGRRLTILATAATTKVANAWSANAVIVPQQNLKGGVYAILGITPFVAGVLAMRMDFPASKMYQGKKLFPGDLVQAAYGNVPNRRGPTWLGIWGAFHTFELPSVQVWGNAAGAATLTMWIELVYLGSPRSILESFYASMAA